MPREIIDAAAARCRIEALCRCLPRAISRRYALFIISIFRHANVATLPPRLLVDLLRRFACYTASPAPALRVDAIC